MTTVPSILTGLVGEGPAPQPLPPSTPPPEEPEEPEEAEIKSEEEEAEEEAEEATEEIEEEAAEMLRERPRTRYLSEEEESEFESEAEPIAEEIDVGRFSDIFLPPKEKTPEERKEEKQRKKEERKRRKKIRETGTIEENEEEERQRKEKKYASRKEKINKGIGKVDTNKFTLWRNFREYLQKEGLAETFDEWNTNMISAVESNCMIKQTTECTDFKRLEILMKSISNDEDPKKNNVKLNEVLELIHDKTAKYRSKIGMRMGQMAHADEETKEDKLEEIKQISDTYANEITKIATWMLRDDHIDVLFPASDLPDNIVDKIKNQVAEDKRAAFSRVIIKKSIKNRIFQLIHLDIDRVISGAQKLSKQVKISYLQNQGLKSIKSWGNHRYEVEAQQMYNFMFKMVRIRDDIRLLEDLESVAPGTQSSVKACANLNQYSKKLYIERLKQISNLFKDYQGIFSSIFETLISTKMIPSPFAQSTYPIITKKIKTTVTKDATEVVKLDIETCNMLMWPDRFANTLNPQLLNMIEFEDIEETRPKLKSQIINDFLDPWYWRYYRQENFPTTMEGKNVRMSKIAQLFLLGQDGQTADYEPEDDEYEDMDLFNGSTRTVIDDHPLAGTRERDPQKIYLIQYMNRLLRGLGNYTDPATDAPFSLGDFVYNGMTAVNVADILHTGEGTLIGEMDISPSEFTLYMEALETTVDSTNGSYLTYRIDTHPATLNEPDANWAGHAYLFNIQPVKTPHIWFKETLAKYKPQGSTVEKPKNVISQFTGWVTKTIQIDAICDNSKTYNWKTFPEWMILMFKLFATMIYGRKDFEQYLVIVPLDKLKRVGNVPENVLVYMLRKYLNFGLCVNEKIQRDPNSEGAEQGLYAGRKDSIYDYDYVLQNTPFSDGSSHMVKLYTMTYSDQTRAQNIEMDNLFEIVDSTEPLLIRPIPTTEELWKMWQFYTQSVYATAFAGERIPNLTEFLEHDVKLKSSRLREILSPASGVRFSREYQQENIEKFQKDQSFDPLSWDEEPLDWNDYFK